MSGRSRGLLDTSTVILLTDIDSALLPDDPLVSTITLAELSVGPLIATDEHERAVRQVHVQQAEAAFDPVPFDVAAARAFGAVSASLRRSGRTVHARTYDALIAAVAIAHALPLYTCNPADFQGIDGLELVPVPHPGA